MPLYLSETLDASLPHILMAKCFSHLQNTGLQFIRSLQLFRYLVTHIYNFYHKIAGRNINNLRYADETTLMAESEELKSLLMKLKERVIKLA